MSCNDDSYRSWGHEGCARRRSALAGFRQMKREFDAAPEWLRCRDPLQKTPKIVVTLGADGWYECLGVQALWNNDYEKALRELIAWEKSNV